MTAETKPFWYFRPAAVDKTVVAADVVKKQVDLGEKVLFLAHRWELLDQAAKKIKTFAGIDSGFEKGEMSNLNGLFPVTVGSVQTLCRKPRLDKFPRDYFQTLIVDEAHHSVSNSYQTVLDHFNGAKVLGMTASIDRADKRDLGEYYDSIAYEYSMRKAIKDGYLVPIIAKMIPLELDLRNVRITTGDFNAEDTAHALEPYLEEIAARMAIHCADRKTVVFLPLVRISQQFRNILERHGFSAVEVNGQSPDREQKLKDFENGKYNILCNCSLLLEGWDCPSVDCVVVLRPTKSRALYQQAVGRGTRLFPGKDNLLVLDFLWQVEKHSLCGPSSLSDKEDKTREKIDEMIKEDEDGIDIFGVEDEAEKKVMDEEAAKRGSTLARQLEKVKGRKSRSVDPIQYAFSIAAEDLANFEPSFAWQMEPPTEKQVSFLEGRGIDPNSVDNAGMASLLIDRLIMRQKEGLSTPKQIRVLERYGFRHVGTWSFESASHIIGMLASNHWRLPVGFNARTYIPA